MKVKLLTKTENMFATISNVWNASRTNDPIQIKNCASDFDKDLFFKILKEDIPIMDMVEFIFLLEDIPISLREQIVRHRLGIKFDDKIGLDIVPDLLDSTFWCQSMRVMDMSDFNYFTPKSIADSIPQYISTEEERIPFAVYQEAMSTCKRVYTQLVEAGIPMEDARQIIPLGATHRMVWKLSLTAIKHICSKRSCWIAQLGMWKPIIKGIVEELVNIDLKFRLLITPPCIQNEKFQECKFCEHNKKRVLGEGEEMPPCPLYLQYHEQEAVQQKNAKWIQSINSHFWIIKNEDFVGEEQMTKMKKEYAELWGRNVITGELL